MILSILTTYKDQLEKRDFIEIITATWKLANIVKTRENNTTATLPCLGDHRILVIPCCIGDLLLMATSRTTDNISSSVQNSMDEVVSFHSCLLANKSLA